MPPVVPNTEKIRAFKSAQAFEAWLSKCHDTETELWLKIHKKDSGLATVTYAEALQVALCWGWIDGLKKSFDDKSFLQRFTPRKPNSVWSQINRDHVARLIAAKRMTPHGLRHVEAAKKNGRWESAYAGQRTNEVPEDLLKAVMANPKAKKTWATLSKLNIYALTFRVGSLKTEVGRARRIAAFVEMLAKGETPYPNKAPRA